MNIDTQLTWQWTDYIYTNLVFVNIDTQLTWQWTDYIYNNLQCLWTLTHSSLDTVKWSYLQQPTVFVNIDTQLTWHSEMIISTTTYSVCEHWHTAHLTQWTDYIYNNLQCLWTLTHSSLDAVKWSYLQQPSVCEHWHTAHLTQWSDHIYNNLQCLWTLTHSSLDTVKWSYLHPSTAFVKTDTIQLHEYNFIPSWTYYMYVYTAHRQDVAIISMI